jgi:multidrug transporter EmrE-like cation transporter
MISLTLAGVVIGMSIIELFGQIFIKTYYETRKTYWFFLGWIFYLFVLFALYQCYFLTGFAIANGLWSSFTVCLTTVVGIFYYGEKLSTMELIGLAMVVVGIFLMGIYSKDNPKALE